jgi:hypothetical protein
MQSNKQKAKIIAFDLDDVLCTRTSNKGDLKKYLSCSPVQKMIDICNECYDSGCEIIIYTARGMTTQNGDVSKIYHNLYELTKAQLTEWGIKHHKLVMGKQHYDLLIDDKAIFSGNINSVSDVEQAIISEK